MRKKEILLLCAVTILTVGCSSKAKLYNIKIDVDSSKINGKEWDLMGGSPDIKVLLDKEPLTLSQSCIDTYRCSYNFTSKEDEWYIEIYDSDIDSDDLIGKGDCEEGEECKLGLATVTISN